MHCTKCGAELAPDAKFCVSCGAAIEAPAEPTAEIVEPVVPVQEETPVAAPEAEKKEGFKIDVTAIKDQLVETLKPVTDKVKPIFAKKAVRFGILGGFALLIVLGLVIGLLTAGNGFVNVKQTTMVDMIDGELNIIVNGKLLKNTIEVGYQKDSKGNEIKDEYLDYSSSRSMDGKITAIWVYGEVYESEDSWSSYTAGDLYVVNGKKIQKVAEDVCDYEISVTGKGIAYMTRNERGEDDLTTTYTLKLYNVGNKKSSTVSDEVASSTIAIAPNGKSVTYFEADEGDEEGEIEYTLMYSNGKKSQKVTSNEVSLVGMSNNGKQIYAIRESESEEKTEYNLYSYNTKGDSNKLGKVDSRYSYDFTFNKDHTQIMYVSESKTFISTKGKEGVKAFNGELSLVTPVGAGYSYRTEPVSNLYGQVYTGSDSDGNRTVWIINKKYDKNEKLASKATSVQMDENAEYLYYLYDKDELRVTKVSYGDKATEKYTVLAEDVDGYMPTPNAEYVYFTSDDTLYSVNGKKGGKKTTVCSDKVSGADITAEGRLYYIVDGDLYTTDNGKKGKKILSDVEDVVCTATGETYATNEDTLFVSTGAKKLKKLMDLG